MIEALLFGFKCFWSLGFKAQNNHEGPYIRFQVEVQSCIDLDE